MHTDEKDKPLKSAILCNFRTSMTLTLDRVIRHTFYIDLYLHTKFRWKRKNFLWTEGSVILVLKLILVFILFSSQNFYFI